MGRLTSDDRKFGPITYGKASWDAFRIILDSGGEDDEDKVETSLTVYMFGWVFRVFHGQLLKPITYKVKAGWDEATITRMGRDWYETSFNKAYGFSYHEGFLQLFFGMQNDMGHYTHVDNEGFVTYKTSDKTKTYIPLVQKSKSWHLPWTQFRTTEYRLYDDKNNLYREMKNRKGVNIKDIIGADTNCPTVNFLLKDFDGVMVTAKTHIEETVYRKGIGKFKWVSWFTKPLICRHLKIEFNKETGPDKGSWKGGTTGMSFDATNYKNHYDAIRAFCDETHRSKSGRYKMQYYTRELPI